MILVVGATGTLGGQIARALLENGKPVRILVRDGSSYDDLVTAGAEAVKGDLKDAESLAAACSGVDIIVTTANAIGRGGEDTIESVDLHGNRKLVDAASAAGVRHFVFTSILGASVDSPVSLLKVKAETEEHLRASGMAWTVLQPNLFMDVWIPMIVGGPALSGQPVTIVGDGKRRHSMVAVRDVVDYTIGAIEQPEDSKNQTLFIGGPDARTWWDVVAAFERELGRKIDVRKIPLGEPLPGFPDVVNGLVQALETYDSELPMDELARTYAVKPTTLEQFVRDFVAR